MGNRNWPGLLSLALLAIPLSACGTHTIQPAQQGVDQRAVEEPRIRDAARRWQEAIGNRDIEKILGFYTDDAWQLPANGPIARTGAERREFWAEISKLPIVTDTVGLNDRIEISRAGNLAAQYGEFRQIIVKKLGDTTSVPQKFINVWRRQDDGQWKVVASMATVQN